MKVVSPTCSLATCWTPEGISTAILTITKLPNWTKIRYNQDFIIAQMFLFGQCMMIYLKTLPNPIINKTSYVRLLVLIWRLSQTTSSKKYFMWSRYNPHIPAIPVGMMTMFALAVMAMTKAWQGKIEQVSLSRQPKWMNALAIMLPGKKYL